MSDTWNIPNPEEKPEETAATQPAGNDAPPAEKPTSTAEQPTAPLNGWSSDGSYRYVPPRTQQPPVPSAQPHTYTSPAGQPSQNGWSAPYGGSTPPPTNKPPKKGRGWIAAVAVLGVLAVLSSVVLVVYALTVSQVDGDDEPSESVQTELNDTKAPSLEISKWDEDDGGLSPKEVVNRNYDSTVVLTAYVNSSRFEFGQSTLVEAGSSSGIVMSKDGYIITNWHCVINESTGKAYDRLDVTTYEGKTYENAEVIGADQSTDLAVIKVDATDLAVAQFGDSDELVVGERVTALGNAAGLSWTATFGYVSALARDVYDDTGYAIQCLQVDAAINPGNSGGPLLNKQGLVVGINSAKIAASGYEGLGFSIPINEAKVIVDSLLKNGYVKGRVALGITGQTVSTGLYNGFMIATINDNSCLKGTRVEVGDLIVAVNNTSIADYGELRSALAQHKVGDTVTLKLLRSDRRTGQVSAFTVKVTLQEQSADE